jgi:hypothetical protein
MSKIKTWLENTILSIRFRFDNLKFWFKYIWNDEDYDYLFIFKILRAKLIKIKKHYLEQINEPNSEYIRDYFKSLQLFIEYIDKIRIIEKMPDRAFRSIQTYIYALDTLIAYYESRLYEIFDDLEHMYKELEEKYGKLKLVKVKKNNVTCYKLRYEFETEENSDKIEKLRLKILEREIRIRDRCNYILKHLFDIDDICFLCD